MNLPNLLTMSRLGLVLIMMAFLSIDFPFSKTLALIVFVVAGITDYLDGHLARKYNCISSFGKLMDPLTDKIMVCAAFVSFVEIQLNVSSKGLVPLVPAWIVVIIIAREFLVTGLRLLAANKGEVLSAGQWGKHKTVWQIIAIVVILLGLAVRHDLLGGVSPDKLVDFDFAFYWIAYSVALAVAAITVASGSMYFLQHRELISQRRR